MVDSGYIRGSKFFRVSAKKQTPRDTHWSGSRWSFFSEGDPTQYVLIYHIVERYNTQLILHSGQVEYEMTFQTCPLLIRLMEQLRRSTDCIQHRSCLCNRRQYRGHERRQYYMAGSRASQTQVRRYFSSSIL